VVGVGPGFVVFLADEEVGAAGRAIDDAGVGPVSLHLVAAAIDGREAGAIDFIFPSDDPSVWEEGAQFGDKLGCRAQMEEEVLGAAGDFAVVPDGAGGGFDMIEAEVAKGGDVVNGGEIGVLRGAAELFQQMVVGGEVVHLHRWGGIGMGGGESFEAKHGEAFQGQSRGQEGAEFAGGEVSDPSHLVDRFVAGPAGDEGAHAVVGFLGWDEGARIRPRGWRGVAGQLSGGERVASGGARRWIGSGC